MAADRTIIDIHVHLFDRVEGNNADGPTASATFGRVSTRGGMIQFMPPWFRETSFSADVILETMDFTGVHKAVLLQNPLIGIVNDAIAKAVEEHPDRFLGTIQVDPLDPAAMEKVRRYSANPRHAILKFEMSDGWGWSGVHKGLTLEDECFTPIWRIALERGLPIILDGGRPGNAGYQVEGIDRSRAGTRTSPSSLSILAPSAGRPSTSVSGSAPWSGSGRRRTSTWASPPWPQA